MLRSSSWIFCYKNKSRDSSVQATFTPRSLRFAINAQ
ncbi:hypothetical protein Acr_21g0001270 [Actinidia rufa]|uniref:Uncharacterized protein n=1 Tax=Actinidia rufa TaxID=165716 RepID=A0A7J0GFP9_9ERIC|nr:hypothetical protein Acr_21g0001270 [Actinidia rufa]